jgi:hypothetical protein
MLQNDVKEEFLFCKTMSLEVFSVINGFLEQKAINWEKCTEGAQSVSGRNAGLQTPVRKKAPHIMWTHCVLHRQTSHLEG